MLLRRCLFTTLMFTFGALAQTTTPTTNTRTTSFPLTGLGSTETAQVNLLNAAANANGGTAASCTGSVLFYNATGAAIGTAASFTLATGQITSMTLPFSKSGGTGAHTVVRAVITLTATSGVPCNLESSLEVYDSTSGVDRVAISGGGVGVVTPVPGR